MTPSTTTMTATAMRIFMSMGDFSPFVSVHSYDERKGTFRISSLRIFSQRSGGAPPDGYL
jgi:hypothetical protein